MGIQVHDHRSPDRSLPLQRANGHSDIMQRAETFSVMRKGMMEAAADMKADALAQGEPRSQQRSAGPQPERILQSRTPGKIQDGALGRAKQVKPEALHITRTVDQEQVAVGDRIRRYEIVVAS
jgi:hypothetical protein